MIKKIFNYFFKKNQKNKSCYIIEECWYHSNFNIIGCFFEKEKAEKFCIEKAGKHREYRYTEVKEIK